MRFLVTFWIIAGFLMVAVAFVATSTPLSPWFEASCEQQYRAEEQQIFREVNQYREENGLQPLEHNAFMDELAKEHCQHLVEIGGIPASDIWGDIAHEGFMERAEEIINTLGATDVSENVAVGPGSVGSWRDSPLHNSNLLNPKWTRTGVGVAGNYACMIFSD